MAKKILLVTYGSYGDLHPYIAMAHVLEKAGYDITLCTSSHYEEKVERENIKFHVLRPGIEELGPEEEWIKQATASKDATEFIFRKLVIPYLQMSYEDLLPLAKVSDLVISHPLAFAVPILGEVLQKKWLSCVLQPLCLHSTKDLPVYPQAAWFRHLSKPINDLGISLPIVKILGRALTDPWVEPIYEFRKSLGLQKGLNPIFEGQFSSLGTLCLFSEFFASIESDWPPHSVCTGFSFFDSDGSHDLSNASKEFLSAGRPPLVFTLGSSVTVNAGNFFDIAFEVTHQLQERAIFLTGPQTDLNRYKHLRSGSIHHSIYEPHSQIFPKAKAIIHQVGIGTTAQALKSGRPQVMIPFANDQFDNAERIQRLGLGISIYRNDLTSRKLKNAIAEVLKNPTYEINSKKIANQIKNENFNLRLLSLINACMESNHSSEA